MKVTITPCAGRSPHEFLWDRNILDDTTVEISRLNLVTVLNVDMALGVNVDDVL